MITAYRHKTLANSGKANALVALFPAFREALGGLQSLTRREILSGDQLLQRRVMPDGSLPFAHRLSGRQMKSVQNMVHGNVKGWQEQVVDRVRELITGSELPEQRKTVLYRINARRAWWSRKLDLPWIADANGELVPCTPRDADTNPDRATWIAVDDGDLKLARLLVKHAQKQHRYPDLRRVNTLVLDYMDTQKLGEARTATHGGGVGWWVKIPTLTCGKPVNVPLAVNPYFERARAAATAAGGKMNAVIQLHLTRNEHSQPAGVEVSLLLETPDAKLRTQGQWLGVDFGFGSALLGTSNGDLLGKTMLARLRELDKILTPYAADLQRRGVSLKRDRYYRSLQNRITGYITNEIGRILNRIAARQGEHAVIGLVVETLDFRGGGLSRRMNRIATRTGRNVLKARLAALTAKHGVEVAEVPSPWTSCECSGCGYTAKRNRNGARFRCRFCGLKLHADVNAARVIASRRSRPTPDHTGPQSRKITFQLLDDRHRQRWGPPARGTVPGVAGAPEANRISGLRGKTMDFHKIAHCTSLPKHTLTH